MSLFGNLISATIKTALTPVALIADVVHVISGKEATSTIDMVASAIEDVKDGVDQGIEGDIL
jgi:hypothetical protein